MYQAPLLDVRLNEAREEYLAQVGYSNHRNRDDMSIPENVVEFLNRYYHAENRSRETLWLLSLDNKLHLTASFELSVGAVNQTIADVREIFKAALMSGAVRIIIAHNHPSGDCTPSLDDETTTKKVVAAGMLMNVQCCDHIVVGNRNYYSFFNNKPDLFR